MGGTADICRQRRVVAGVSHDPGERVRMQGSYSALALAVSTKKLGNPGWVPSFAWLPRPGVVRTLHGILIAFNPLLFKKSWT